MTIARQILPLFALASLGVASGVAGCGSNPDEKDGNGGGGSSSGMVFGMDLDSGSGDGSMNLPRCIEATKQCVASCSGSTTTNVTGTVYDPAGRNPLYGIVVYVPSVPPGPLPAGAGCYTCSSLYQSGKPIAYAVTDAGGKFTLQGVPDGANIPLVVQVGKWRMQYKLPTVNKCVDNDATSAAQSVGGKLRLPKNHTEGDIPDIAIATGGADSLECLLSRIGVDKSEYGAGMGGTGRIHIFYGDGGSNTTPAAPNAWTSLWTTKQNLMPFDITLLTCEGHETSSDGNRAALTQGMQQALYDYAAAGGRVFASHYHYAWFNTGPFGMQNLAKWTTGTQDIGDINGVVQQMLPNGQSFPRGVAMQQWLMNVGALTNGELPIQQARHNADVSAANTASTPWILADSRSPAPNATEYFSFDTPFGTQAAEQCGRVVYSDLHVGAASGDYGQNPAMSRGTLPPGSVVPSGCANNALSPQEKALEFMLFDLSGCITPPDQGAGGVPSPPTK
jgi:hypothetical protein